MLICAREECKAPFKAKTHNQKYCGSACCKIETNRRIMQQYYKRRDRKLGKTRHCDVCEKTRLSRYNESNVCSSCELRNAEQTRRNVRDMLLAISA